MTNDFCRRPGAASLLPSRETRFQDAVATISRQALDLGARMPHPVPRLDDHSAARIVARFVTTIPGMIVTTKLLRLALRVAPVDKIACSPTA